MPLERPQVLVNCAISLDGKLAFAGGRPAPLSGPEDLVRVQRLRAESDAILVGLGTVLADDPSLRVHWELLGETPGPSPLRICLDARGQIPERARLLDGSQATLIVTTAGCSRRFPPPVQSFGAGEGDQVDLGRLLQELHRRGHRRLLVEGGSRVIGSFLRAGLVDRLTVYIAPVVLGGSSAPSFMGGVDSRGPEEWVALERTGVEPLGAGILSTFRLRPGGNASARAPL